MGGFNSVTTLETIVFADNASFDGTERGGALSLDGQLWIGSTTGRHVRKGTLTAGTGITITNGPGTITIGLAGGAVALETLSDDVSTIVTPLGNNIQLVGHVVEAGATKFSTVVAGANLLNINPMSSSRWIVDPLGFNGTHTTIASAITSASSGDTIFLLPGTFTENITLKAGVNIAAYNCDAQRPNVTISGTLSISSGVVSISGVNLSSNGAAVVAASGTGLLKFYACNFSIATNTGITSSSTQSIYLFDCTGTVNNTNCFAITAGSIYFVNSYFVYGGGTLTNSTATNNSNIYSYFSQIGFPLETANTAIIEIFNSNLIMTGNTTALTVNGTGQTHCFGCLIESNNAAAITVGAGVGFNLYTCVINSSAANVITGTGTLFYGDLVFKGNSGVTVTTQTPLAIGPVLANQDGSMTSPSYSFKSDLTTGMYLGGNKLHLAGGGFDALNFDLGLSNMSILTANTYIQKITMQSGLVSTLTTPGAYPYTTLASDYVILVDTSSARTINLIAAPTAGATYRIRDNVGSAAANNITISGNGKNINGAASYTINVAYGAVDLIYNGTEWGVY